MAKLGGNPNSATNQWFFNQSDSNAANLDSQNGCFTVFGRILGSPGLATMDVVAFLLTYNLGSPFDDIPLKDYIGGPVQDANLVHLIPVREIPVPVVLSLSISRPSVGLTRLKIVGAPSTSYSVESSISLLEDSFSPLTTLTTEASGSVSFDEATAAPRKFYRLVIP